MSKVLRTVKNVVKNFTIPEVKVREATSNDPWFASTVELDELAQYTFQPKSQHEIFQILFKRLHDIPKYWRHILKSLIVLEYLSFHGHEDIYKLLTTTSSIMHTLTTFMFVDTDGKDKGNFIRERAKRMVQYIENVSYFKIEQDKARKTRLKVQKTSTERSSSTFSKSLQNYSITNSTNTQPEYAPRNREEEDLQLQLALAISKQEADDMKAQREEFSDATTNKNQFDVFNQPSSSVTRQQLNHSTGNITQISNKNQIFDVFNDNFNTTTPPKKTSIQPAVTGNSTNPEIFNIFDTTQPSTNSNNNVSNFDPFQIPLSSPFNNSTNSPISNFPTRPSNTNDFNTFNDFMKSSSPFDPVTTVITTQTDNPDISKNNKSSNSTPQSDAINFVNNSGLVDLSLKGFCNQQPEKATIKKQSLNELMGKKNSDLTVNSSLQYPPPNLSYFQPGNNVSQNNLQFVSPRNESYSFAPVNQFSQFQTNDYQQPHQTMYSSHDSFSSPMFQNTQNSNQNANRSSFQFQNQQPNYQQQPNFHQLPNYHQQQSKRQKNPFEENSNDQNLY